MDNTYLTVQCAGFITYCDALIARLINSEFQAFFFSLIGTPSHIQASSAILFGGDSCRVWDNDNPAVPLAFSGTMRTYRNRKIGDSINKIMVSLNYFLDTGTKHTAIVYGPDISTAQERAFLRFDAETTIPLKPQWQGWIWDEILQPEKLFSFGDEELQETYLISWPDDEKLQEQILEGVSQTYLT